MLCPWLLLPRLAGHGLRACAGNAVLWLALAALAAPAPVRAQGAAAAGITPTGEIAAAALAELGLAGTGAEALVDPLLRLAACSRPLQALPTGPRTVQVRCADTPGWRVYVPVRARRESGAAGPVAVQVQAPAAGGGPLEGTPVQRGDPVVLVSRAGGIEVRMAGRALGRAAPGDTVAVENLASRRIIRGRLGGGGEVVVLH